MHCLTNTFPISRFSWGTSIFFLLLTNFVEVEWEFAGDGAVEARLQVRRPILRQNILSAGIVFTNPGYAGVDAFPAVDVLDGGLAEEEKHILADIVRSDEIWLWNEEIKNFNL